MSYVFWVARSGYRRKLYGRLHEAIRDAMVEARLAGSLVQVCETDRINDYVTVFSNGQVLYHERGEFCDEHDDCFADKALGRACFQTRISSAEVLP